MALMDLHPRLIGERNEQSDLVSQREVVDHAAVLCGEPIRGENVIRAQVDAVDQGRQEDGHAGHQYPRNAKHIGKRLVPTRRIANNWG